MFSPHTNKIYYIGTKVKDNRNNLIGEVYELNVLKTIGIKVRFTDKIGKVSKKAYIGDQLTNLTIIS